MLRSILVATSLSLLLAGCNSSANAVGTEQARNDRRISPAGLEVIPLQIDSGSTVHRFSVEIAATPAQQQQGLMFRTELGPYAGMLFPLAQERPASFWMKNTVISLDIIFIDRDRKIESIAANTVPYSLESVPSEGPVIAVLELAGGRSAELGIEPGDRVSWQEF